MPHTIRIQSTKHLKAFLFYILSKLNFSWFLKNALYFSNIHLFDKVLFLPKLIHPSFLFKSFIKEFFKCELLQESFLQPQYQNGFSFFLYPSIWTVLISWIVGLSVGIQSQFGLVCWYNIYTEDYYIQFRESFFSLVWVWLGKEAKESIIEWDGGGREIRTQDN